MDEGRDILPLPQLCGWELLSLTERTHSGLYSRGVSKLVFFRFFNGVVQGVWGGGYGVRQGIVMFDGI